MGKNKVIKFLNVGYLGVLAMLYSIISCGQQTMETPIKFKNHFIVNPEEYTRDSMHLYYLIESMMYKNIKPFTPPTYYAKSTKIFIDSILYSPDNLRMIVFVISKVKIGASLNGEEIFEYNANFLFCIRDTLLKKVKVFEYSPYNLGNFETYFNVKAALYELCFIRRATDPWSKNEPRFNMDDIRFWSSKEFNDIILKNRFVVLD